jgi:hypothetical protein
MALAQELTDELLKDYEKPQGLIGASVFTTKTRLDFVTRSGPEKCSGLNCLLSK